MYDLVSGNGPYGDVEGVLTGAYDIVGAPMYGGMGGSPYGASPYNPAYAAQNRALQMQQAQQQAIQQRMVQNGALLRTMNPTKARRQFLGMESSGTIAAAGTATITARPQSFAFKPERIFIPASVGPDFIVTDIKVGNVSQLVQSGNLPAEAFSQTSFGVEMDFDTVQTSQDFIIQVQNISGAARTFRAMILGRAANG